MRRRVCAGFLFLSAFGLAAPPTPIPSAVQPALRAIKAADLKGDLSFLSSDALAGRYTPSPGLDVAAEFIASRFRAAGLQPAGDDGYFQTAHMIDRRIPQITKDLTYSGPGGQGTVSASSLALSNAGATPISLDNCPVVVFATKDPDLLKGFEVKDKVIVAPMPVFSRVPENERAHLYERSRAFDEAVEAAGAKLEILVGRARRVQRDQLVEAGSNKGAVTPVMVADNDVLKKWLDQKPSPGTYSVSIDLPPAEDHPVTLKNVIGTIPGSDSKLKDTYVLLTAHYDHIGTSETAVGKTSKTASGPDHIYNGANDDGSGTVSVIEIARALSSLPVHPRRTLVFMTFFGEERGDIGSAYYGRHPVFPLSRTVADVNLEQVGRTDETHGKQVNSASLTGFDYSDVTSYLQRAGRQTGISIRFDKEGSDAYFERSDNAALAIRGVPAHSLCVAFDFPDYHGLGDEWTKIDYDNMTRVDRAVALALWYLGNAERAPQWNAKNSKTARFREAQRHAAAS